MVHFIKSQFFREILRADSGGLFKMFSKRAEKKFVLCGNIYVFEETYPGYLGFILIKIFFWKVPLKVFKIKFRREKRFRNHHRFFSWDPRKSF